MNTLLTLHDPALARRYYEEGVWRQETFYSLLQSHAKARGERYALRDTEQRITYAQLVSWVDAVADDLHRAGLRQGDRVSVCLPSRVESVVIMLACSRNGYVCNPSLHQNYTIGELIILLERIGSKVLFAQPGYGVDADRNDIFAAAKQQLPRLRTYALEPVSPVKGRTMGNMTFPEVNSHPHSVLAADLNPDKVIYLAFTSGTTGTPKAVMHSDNTLLANARSLAEDWGHTFESIILSLSPMSHHIGTVAVGQALTVGAELVVNGPRKGLSVVDWIANTKATYVMGVPTHAIDVLAEMKRRQIERLGSVRVFYMAGATIPRETAQRFLDYDITPQNIYGMSENSSHNYTLPSDSIQTIVETCGRPGRGYEIRIWNEATPDLEVGPGEVGEIGGRGGCLMLGYFDNQLGTESSFNAHGWFMSGDLGRIDENGCLRFVGRKKDLIIRGGHNIYPIQIENLAVRHPSVKNVTVFPVMDDRVGEKVCLAIIPMQGAKVSAEDMLRYLDEAGLSKYDMPEYFICLESFPLTPSGKILKRSLVEWVKSGQITPMPVRFSRQSVTEGRDAH